MLTKSFNLLDDAWIPCVEKGSPRSSDKSLLEVLSGAPELRAIQHASPIVTLVLHRFVVSFLYAALRGPRNVSSLKSILDTGHFDSAEVIRYASTVRDSFWLFHPHRPFLQDPRLPEEMKHDSDAPTSIYQLSREAAPPRGKTLFDHVVSGGPHSLTAAEAARYLVADQFFALQDGRGYAPSMLTFGAALFIRGESLFETLALNLLPYNIESPIKSPNLEHDRPFWERNESEVTAFPDGWLDYLTRPYRRLLLVSRDGEAVTHVYRKAAAPLDREWRSLAKDPWIAYRVSDKGDKPIPFTTERALWRDSLALIQYLAGREKGAPGYRNLLARLDRGAELNACGVVAGNNDVDLWRHERLPLPGAYLSDPELTDELGRAIALAERARGVLADRFGWVARYLLIPTWDQLSAAEQAKQWNELTKRPRGKPSRLDNLFQTLNWERPYWAALDAPFRVLMVDLAEAWPRNDQHHPLREWAQAVQMSAVDAFESAARALETSGRGFRAAAEARGSFGARIRRALEAFLPDGTPRKEDSG